jgi:hypothetical protein
MEPIERGLSGIQDLRALQERHPLDNQTRFGRDDESRAGMKFDPGRSRKSGGAGTSPPRPDACRFPHTLQFVVKRFGHHSRSSGYDHVRDFLPEGRTVRPFASSVLRRLCGSIYFRLMRGRIGSTYYGFESCQVDLKTYLDSIVRRNAVYHVLYADELWGLLRARRGIRVFATFHQPAAMLARIWSNRAVFDRLTGIICVARAQLRFFEETATRSAVHFVPHGVDLTAFAAPAERRFRNQGPWRCLVVGNWLRDFETLHRVADALHFEHENQVHFTVLALREHAAAVRLCANVEIKSGLSEGELRQAYGETDLLVLPLKDSTANNALLEGMACGTPTVVTDVGGVRDYADESCSVLVPPADPQRLCEAIQGTLGNISLRKRLSQSARLQAAKYDWRRIADRLRAIYCATP